MECWNSHAAGEAFSVYCLSKLFSKNHTNFIEQYESTWNLTKNKLFLNYLRKVLKEHDFFGIMFTINDTMTVTFKSSLKRGQTTLWHSKLLGMRLTKSTLFFFNLIKIKTLFVIKINGQTSIFVFPRNQHQLILFQ